MTRIKFKKWYNQVLKSTGSKFFDLKLYLYLFKIYERAKYDNYDAIIVVDGNEGDGKSTQGIQIASILDPEFNIDRVNLNPEGFMDDLKVLGKAMATQYDEASTGLFSREAMSKLSTTLIKMFTLIRSKNLFIVLCIPDFYIIDKYLRNVRIHCLIHKTDKRKYQFYDKQKVVRLSKFNNWNDARKKVSYNFRGTCNKQFPNQVSQEEYEKKKAESTHEVIDDLANAMTKGKPSPEFISLPNACHALGIKYSTGLQYVHEGLWKGFKRGGRWTGPFSVIFDG